MQTSIVLTPRPNAAAIARDSSWLAHRYDPVGDSVHFRFVSRDAHREATFLTDEDLGVDAPIALDRTQAHADTAAIGPLHFIFHSAFCGSTLLARALDIDNVAMTLKEPVILNDIVGWRHRGAENARVARVMDTTLHLLSRPFSPGETVIVKPSNIVNGLAPLILAMRPEAHALLLYTPLRAYLASIAKKGMWGRLWVRDLFIKPSNDGLIDFGFTPQDYMGQTDLQIAAIGWLAQHALFARLIDRHPQRLRTLDSETLVAEPARVVAALTTLFGLRLTPAAIVAIAEGQTFRRHSKSGTPFGSQARAEEQRNAFAAHGDEIEKVAVWAEAVAGAANIHLRPPSPLLG